MAEAKIVLSAVDRSSPAFASAKRNLADLQAGFASVAARFAGVGALVIGAATAFEQFNPVPVFEQADALGKLSEKTGISVEKLSAYQYAASLANVSNEELGVGFKNLNLSIAAAARGEAEQAEAFQKLGISIKDASGAVRGSDQIFEEVADKIAGYADGPEKGAIANAIFKRSFEALIPLLNGGATGLRDAADEAERFGIIMGADLAAKSQQFNDNLTRLAAAGTAFKISLAGGLIDTLVDYSDRAVNAAKSGNLLAFSVEHILDVLSGKVTREAVFGKSLEPAALTAQQKEVERLDNLIVGLQNNLSRDPGNEGIIARLGRLTDQLRKAQAEVAGEKIGGGRGVVNPPLVVPDAPKPKPPAPALGGGGGGSRAGASSTGNELALLKRELDGRTQDIAQSLAAEQQLLRFNEQYVEAVYRSGNTNLEATFTAQNETRRRNIEEIRSAAAATIAAEQQFQSKVPKPKDEAGKQRNDAAVKESENRIQAARAKLQAAEIEFQQIGELAAVQRPEQREQLQEQVRQFNAGLQDLVDGGRTRATELADIAVRTRDATKLLVEGGADPASAAQQAQAYGAALEQQRQLNLVRDEFARLTDQASDAEERLHLEQQAGGTGLLEGERQVYDLRQKQLVQIDALIDRLRALAAAQPDNLPIAESLRKAELEAQRLRAALDPTKLRLDAAADNIGDAIANGLSRANTEGKSLKDTIKGIGKNIFDIVEQELVTKPLAKQIGELVKGAGGQGAGENLIGKLFGLNRPQGAAASGQSATAASAENAALRDLFATERGDDPAAQLAASLGTLQATGSEPATAALQRLAQAADSAAGSLGVRQGTPVPALPIDGAATTVTGDSTGENYGNEAKRAAGDASADLTTALVDTRTSAQELNDAIGPVTQSLATLGPAGQAAALALRYLPAIIQSLDASTGGGSGGGGGYGALIGSVLGLFGGGGTGSVTSAFSQTSIGGSGFGSGFAYGNEDLGLFLHDGGVVGQDGEARAVPGGLFGALPRFHEGGVVGEHRVVLQAGEEVIDPEDPRHRDNAGLESPAMSLLAQQGGIIVKRLGVPVPGLAADEVPATLPEGVEVLTADDPRHSANGGAGGKAGAEAGTVLAMPAGADVDRGRTWDPEAWDDAVRHHAGGVVGDSGGSPMARADASIAGADRQSEGRGGDTFVDLRGLRVDSHGQMDSMAEDRAAARIARKAQGYLGRRGA